MKRKTLVLILLFVLFIIQPLKGQEKTWSLDDCISYALENNITLKRERLTAETSKNNYLNSKLQLLPNLNGFSSTSYNWGKTFSYDILDYVEESNLDGYFGIRTSIDLFTGLQNLHTIQQNKYNLLASLESVEGVKNDITLAIAAAYLQILMNKELLTLSEEQHEVTRLQVERAEKLVEVGREAKGNLLEMQAQEAMERSNVVNASNTLKNSILLLTQLLNLDSVGGFEIEYPEIIPVDDNTVLQSVSFIYAEAESFIPQIKSAEFLLKSQEKALAVAKGQRSPTLSLSFLDYSRYNELAIHPSKRDADPDNDVDTYPYMDQIRDFEYKQLTLDLNIPIFNRWNTQNRISTAKIALEDSKLNLDLAKQILYEAIQQAHANAVAALENYFAKQESVISNQEAFKYAEERFNVGMVNSVEYNLAKNNLTRAQSEFLQAKYDYIFKTKILDFYQGIELKL